MTKTEINQVSYRGTAPAMTDVVAGVVDVMFTGPPSAKAMSEGGKLKCWRSPSPTAHAVDAAMCRPMHEAGVPGYRARRAGSACWRRRRRRSRLSTGCRAEVQKAVADPKFTGKLMARVSTSSAARRTEMLALMQATPRNGARSSRRPARYQVSGHVSDRRSCNMAEGIDRMAAACRGDLSDAGAAARRSANGTRSCRTASTSPRSRSASSS